MDALSAASDAASDMDLAGASLRVRTHTHTHTHTHKHIEHSTAHNNCLPSLQHPPSVTQHLTTTAYRAMPCYVTVSHDQTA